MLIKNGSLGSFLLKALSKNNEKNHCKGVIMLVLYILSNIDVTLKRKK